MCNIQAQFLLYFEQRGMELPHYTTGNKITEEAKELREALMACLADPTDYDKFLHVMHETADLVITATAVANQLGFTVEDAITSKTEKDRGRGGVRVP